MSDDNVIQFPANKLTRGRLIQDCRNTLASLARAQGRGQVLARAQLDAMERIIGSVYDDHMGPYDHFQQQILREDLPTDTKELMELVQGFVEACNSTMTTMFAEIVRLRFEGAL